MYKTFVYILSLGYAAHANTKQIGALNMYSSKWRQVSFYAVSLLHNFVLMQLENLYHFSDLYNNFQLKSIWHRYWCNAIWLTWSSESDTTVLPSVTCMDWLHWWYRHVLGVLFPSAALAFGTRGVRNVNLYHLVQSNWKIGKRQLVLKRN
jgi:hypothetical protein